MRSTVSAQKLASGRALACIVCLGLLACSHAARPAASQDAGLRLQADAARASDAGHLPVANHPDAGRTTQAGDAQTSSAPADAAAADATTTPTDAAAPQPTGRSCKRGVAYNHELAADAPAFGRSIGSWYDWSPAPSASVATALGAANVEYVPMVWSAPPSRSLDVQNLIDTIPQGTRYLLGFNEPNFGKQASLTPEQAAAAWPQLEQVARARGLKLVSPALNYCGGSCNQTDPFVWLDAFFKACSQCQVDYVAFHWYACSLDALKSIVGKYESKYGKPVWLTEFACLDDPGDHSAAGQLAYMKQAVPFLEADPMVFRYAWFIGRSTQAAANDLFAAPGTLTPLGSAYADLPGACQ